MERLGYVNPWTPAPTTMSNMYFTELLDTKWYAPPCHGLHWCQLPGLQAIHKIIEAASDELCVPPSFCRVKSSSKGLLNGQGEYTRVVDGLSSWPVQPQADTSWPIAFAIFLAFMSSWFISHARFQISELGLTSESRSSPVHKISGECRFFELSSCQAGAKRALFLARLRWDMQAVAEVSAMCQDQEYCCRSQKKWWGPKQFEDPSKELMMLPTDLVRSSPWPILMFGTVTDCRLKGMQDKHADVSSCARCT